MRFKQPVTSLIVVAMLSLWITSAWGIERDSLLAVISRSYGNPKLQAMVEYADLIAEEKPDSAASIANNVLERLDDNQHLLIGMCYMAIGKSEIARENYKASYSAYTSAMPHLEAIDNRSLQINAYNNIAWVLQKGSYFDRAYQAYQKALKLESNDKKGIARIYKNIGLMFYSAEKPNDYFDWMLKSLAINEQLQNTEEISDIAFHLGKTYIERKQWLNAEKYLLKALEGYHEYSVDLNKGMIQVNLGIVYNTLKDYAKAIDYTMLSIETNILNNNTEGLITGYITLSEIYASWGNRHQALSELETSKALNDHLPISINYIDNIRRISEIYNYLGEYKTAIAYKDQYIALTDSMYNLEQKATVEKQHQINDEQFSRNEELESQIYKLQLWGSIFTASIIILLLSYIIYTRYHQQRFKIEMRQTAIDLNILRANFTPSLLFNSLTNLQYYILENQQTTALDYLGKYSKLLRLILSYSQEEFIKLSQEREIIELYLSLQAERLNHRITYIIHTNQDIDEDRTVIPPMIGLPFLEQIIEQGLPSISKEGTIWISFSTVNNMLIYRIHDNGLGKQIMSKGTDSPSILNAYKITKQRINLINQGTYAEFPLSVRQINSEEKEKFVVEISIPLNILTTTHETMKDVLMKNVQEKSVL